MSSEFGSSSSRNEEQIRSKGGRRRGMQSMSELQIQGYLKTRDVLRRIQRTSSRLFLDGAERNLRDRSEAGSYSFDRGRNRALR